MSIKCHFFDLLNGENHEKEMNTFYEIVADVNSLFKKVLKGLENEKNFKDIFSPEDFIHFLGNYFLQENANVIEVRIDPVFETIKSKELLGNSFFLSIAIAGRNQTLAVFTIECTRQDFETLAETIKEERRKKIEREVEKITSTWK